MALEFTEKQSYEEYTIAVSFAENMIAGETISSQTATAIDKAGEDKTSIVISTPSLANSGQKVTLLIKGGIQAESPYKLTIRCVTSLGHKWEKDILLKIKEL